MVKALPIRWACRICGQEYDSPAKLVPLSKVCSKPACQKAAASDTALTLYTRALQADARYSETVKSRTGGRDRWTMTGADLLIPEIRIAYKLKLAADKAWLDYMRSDSERRTRARRGAVGEDR